jgi:hypothetical protein
MNHADFFRFLPEDNPGARFCCNTSDETFYTSRVFFSVGKTGTSKKALPRTVKAGTLQDEDQAGQADEQVSGFYSL